MKGLGLLFGALLLLAALIGCKGEADPADPASAPHPKTAAEQETEARLRAMPPPESHPPRHG